MCVPMHSSANGMSCFATKAECETCYENEGGMCVKMHRPADGSVCFSTATACEHQRRLEMTPTGEVETQETVDGSLVEAAAVGSAGCYRFQNGACGLMLGVIDKSSCFSSKAACERSNTCFANEGGMCVPMHSSANGMSCFATKAECETCYENEGGMCVKMHRPADGSVCFSTAT